MEEQLPHMCRPQNFTTPEGLPPKTKKRASLSANIIFFTPQSIIFPQFIILFPP